MKLPIQINTTKSALLGYAGVSFFIWVAKDSNNPKKTAHHETIHFWQQVEMLFIPMWILYILSYVWNLFKYGGHEKAYKNIPFEKEAYANDKDFEYLKKRKPYSSLKYFFKN